MVTCEDERAWLDILRARCGMPPALPTSLRARRDPWAPAALALTERSAEFERLALNRRIMGALRYGLLGAPGKPRYDRVGDAIRRLREYADTGSLELLVDVANLALLEFVEGKHPKRHWSTKDDGPHTPTMRGEHPSGVEVQK